MPIELLRTPTLALLVAMLPVDAVAQPPVWTVEAALGGSYAFDTPLRIAQASEPTLSWSASFATRPTEAPLYYGLRLGRWRSGRAWEAELVHQKLFLRDPPPEVQRFAISHGYNLLAVGRARETPAALWRLGAGLVIAHPETVIRGRAPERVGALDSGYEIGGPTFHAGLGKRWPLAPRLFLAVEGKLTLSYARVEIAHGHAEVPHVGLHALIGMGWRSARESRR